MKLIRIKIRDLPADTVAQLAARRRDKPKACVGIRTGVRFFYLLHFVLSSQLPISTEFINVDSKRT